MVEFFKPTREEIRSAEGKQVPDVIAPGLKVLFCGINPSLYSGAVRHHFARPGNRFWPALYEAGFTERLLSPFEELELLAWGYGITNLVERATAGARDLKPAELAEGGEHLSAKVALYRPRYLAILGIGAYRHAFIQPKAVIGEQVDHHLGDSKVWVLPNPSGLNAHYQLGDLAQLYEELRLAADGRVPPGSEVGTGG